jgi:cytochrome c
MFSSRDLRAAVLGALWLAGGAVLAQPAAYPGIGRTATPKEIAAWDIDVRPDFKGLPAGAGSVAKGMEVWEGKCASCHGVFGESNEVFAPLVGGTTQDDVRTGRVARLTDPGFPGRTTLMKLSSLSTLWDYIHRAMPWTQPKSLSIQEVYAVTAYLLHLGGVVPDGFVLSDGNIADVQKLLPNRNGKTTDHGLWPGRGMGSGGKPDVKAAACMSDCATEPTVASFLPDFARDAHGNLADQNRLVGAQRGADTARPAAAGARPGGQAGGNAALALAQKHTCTACHGVDNKLVGPAFREIAAKYGGKAGAETYLAGKIKAGGQGAWGAVPMPPQALPEADARAIAAWLAAGAGM